MKVLSLQSRDAIQSKWKEEFSEAFKSLPASKAPDSDGFCPEFYKNMAKLLFKPITRMYTESFEWGHIPQTLNLANISLVIFFKKDKPKDCCPKLISKLTANCYLNFSPGGWRLIYLPWSNLIKQNLLRIDFRIQMSVTLLQFAHTIVKKGFFV